MRSVIFSFFAACLCTGFAFGQGIPFNVTPDWQSNPNSHIATGLGLADINGDGWKDLIVANGNDILIQRLVVYYNNGDGTFPHDPDWQSDDIDYHGHLAVGDINLDGWPDVAVSVYIGHAGFSQPGKVKVYYNTGGELESTPSFESYSFYTFSCALGDADGDGDLDLATTGGEMYGNIFDKGKIFYNNNGFFSEYPEWETDNIIGSIDVEFGDIDNNGFLDVIFACGATPNFIYLADSNGVISTSPAWQSSEPSNYTNSLDVGFTSGNATIGLVVTGNNQLGGDGKVRHYTFETGVPPTSAASWTSNPFGYGSGILLADVNQDGFPDLIYGGWWLPIKIALGDANGFELNTSYTSSTNSVVEAIQMADLNRNGIEIRNHTITVSQTVSVIYLQDQLIENILDVTLNGKSVQKSFFTYVPNKNWISFKDNLSPGTEVTVTYEYSASPDMVITNWDSGKGNYIFYNSPQVGMREHAGRGPLPSVLLKPNPAAGFVSVEYVLQEGATVEITVLDINSRKVAGPAPSAKGAGKHTDMISTSHLSNGTYIVEFTSSGRPQRYKLMIRQ